MVGGGEKSNTLSFLRTIFCWVVGWVEVGGVADLGSRIFPLENSRRLGERPATTRRRWNTFRKICLLTTHPCRALHFPVAQKKLGFGCHPTVYSPARLLSKALCSTLTSVLRSQRWACFISPSIVGLHLR